MDNRKQIPHELLVYSPGNETRNAGFYPDQIIDDIEKLDSKIYAQLTDTYGYDEECELDEENESRLRQGIIAYINDLKCTMTVKYALRRFICETYGRLVGNRYYFDLEDADGKGFVVSVGNYADEEYELTAEDLETYVVIWKNICAKYNTCADASRNLVCTTAEIKRYIRDTEVCKRETMFRIAFALHMDNEITAQFLSNVLADRIYNPRVPEELIYQFCQSHPEYNSYCTAMEFVEKYNTTIKAPAEGGETENYTGTAVWKMENGITTPDQLFAFLYQYQPNFDGSGRTIHANFMSLYNTALECAQLMNPGSDEQIDNPEALAKEIFSCIPRTYRKGSQEGDFVKINASTSSLYTGVLNSALLSDRMRKIIKGTVAAQKKDLIVLYFYIFCTQIELQGGKCIYNYETFRLEMNAILMECGMSGLYALNRFDNLVMLSFWSVNPYEFFGDVISESFGEE